MAPVNDRSGFAPTLEHRNVVIAGETGVGKSSFINLVIGADSAPAGNDVKGLTTRPMRYIWETESLAFHLWDTPGLAEGSYGSVSPKAALKALRSLLKKLSRKEGGVHLLVMCMRSTRAIKGTKQIYHDILKIRNQVSPQTAIVAVVTELENQCQEPDIRLSMEQWWTDNESAMTDSGMVFCGHVCLTTLDDDGPPRLVGRRAECRRIARNLLVHHSLQPTIVRVILFGETGVGKSSLVNLLAGRRIASTSPDSPACTRTPTEYQISFDATTVHLWDTVGLEQPGPGSDNYIRAIEEAAKLIRRLNKSGGIDLFLFCVRGDRVTPAMKNNHCLFYEVLGKKQVPIALAVTNLEQESIMEEWWERNSRELEGYGIRVSGHACVTTLEEDPKYTESRDAVRGLLCRHATRGKGGFSVPWWTRFGRRLSEMGMFLFGMSPKAKDLVHTLKERCGLTPEDAQKVAGCIEGTMNA